MHLVKFTLFTFDTCIQLCNHHNRDINSGTPHSGTAGPDRVPPLQAGQACGSDIWGLLAHLLAVPRSSVTLEKRLDLPKVSVAPAPDGMTMSASYGESVGRCRVGRTEGRLHRSPSAPASSRGGVRGLTCQHVQEPLLPEIPVWPAQKEEKNQQQTNSNNRANAARASLVSRVGSEYCT